MRHRKAGHKLGRTASHRKALLRNMATSLIENERIITTEGKARALRPFAERLVTLGKRGDLHARRLALRRVRSKAAARKLFEDIGPRFADRPGGYTRIIKMGLRDGDAAPMAMIQLLGPDEKPRKKAGTRRRRRRRSKASGEAASPAESGAAPEEAAAAESDEGSGTPDES